MNRNLIIILVVVVLAAGGVLFISNQSAGNKDAAKNSGPAMERIDDSSPSSQSSTPDGQTALTDSSQYVEYSKEALDQNGGKKRVLFFYASWCPVCIPADKDFRENAAKFPQDVVLIRVNYNDPETDQEEKDLAKKYAVTYQHTFVQIDSAGKEVTKWNGGSTEDLLANLK